MASAETVNPYDYKIFVGIFLGASYAPADLLIESVWNSMAQAPTASERGRRAALWNAWSVKRKCEPSVGEIPDEDGLSRWSGFQFMLVSNYRAPEEGENGAVSLDCRAHKHPWKERSMLALNFGNYPGPPGWRTYVSEAVVLETVVHVSKCLRSILARDANEPLFSLTQGAWVHDQLAEAGQWF